MMLFWRVRFDVREVQVERDQGALFPNAGLDDLLICMSAHGLIEHGHCIMSRLSQE
jgi:hypothetical protein